MDLRLFRENCTVCNGVLVKDLSLLKRNLDSVILIDVLILYYLEFC